MPTVADMPSRMPDEIPMSMPSILENHPGSQEGQPDTEPDQHAKLDSLSGYGDDVAILGPDHDTLR